MITDPPLRRPDLGNLRGSGQMIMVVDDEQAVRDIAVAILQKYGYATVSASNGNEALEKFMQGNGKIEAVISDMAMPGMDGPTLVKMLRQVEPGVRIIGMSGHGDGGGSRSRAPWGIPTFLTKPFTIEHLLNALHATLQAPRPPA